MKGRAATKWGSCSPIKKENVMSRIAKAAVVTLGTSAVVLGGAGLAAADAGAEGKAVGSPGVLSGNVVQVPVNVPVNVCGNTINVVGLLNPAFGNVCVNKSHDSHKGNPGPSGYGH
ncbi:chaplin [Streptomyces phaeolivaceus]|uniref:Chaplin n=2 Tax=Streptomyces phaeolivaceus TaxID=2653200 RepID=A0A5P8K2J0_9ACTN|nr:chaplin [Streptomyces phaeolivaceus]